MKTENNFKLLYPLSVPVLFLIFKRLDTTKQVFEQIYKTNLVVRYAGVDKPRGHRWVKKKREGN